MGEIPHPLLDEWRQWQLWQGPSPARTRPQPSVEFHKLLQRFGNLVAVGDLVAADGARR